MKACSQRPRRPATTLSGLSRLAGAIVVLTLAACGDRNEAPPAAVDDDALADHQERLAAIEARIDAITDQLSPSGRGAYASGPALLVDQQGADSLLQRLHELREELAASYEAMERHRATLTEIRSRLESALAENKDLRGEVAILARHRKSLEIARQELAEANDQIAGLRERVVASQRRRLVIERAYADFARELLALEPLDTRELVDLQSRVRNDVGELWPEDAPGDPEGDPGALR